MFHEKPWYEPPLPPHKTRMVFDILCTSGYLSNKHGPAGASREARELLVGPLILNHRLMRSLGMFRRMSANQTRTLLRIQTEVQEWIGL